MTLTRIVEGRQDWGLLKREREVRKWRWWRHSPLEKFCFNGEQKHRAVVGRDWGVNGDRTGEVKMTTLVLFQVSEVGVTGRGADVGEGCAQLSFEVLCMSHRHPVPGGLVYSSDWGRT